MCIYIYCVHIYIYIIQITTVSSKYLKGTVLWLGLNCTDWENSTGEDNSTRLKSLLQHPYPHWTYLHGCVQSSACQPRARVTSIPSDPAGIWAARCLSIQSADQNSSRQNSRKHRNPGSQLARPVALEFSKCTPRRTTTSHAECCYSPNMFPHLPNYRFADWLLTSPGNLELSGDSVAKIWRPRHWDQWFPLISQVNTTPPCATFISFIKVWIYYGTKHHQHKRTLAKMKTHTPAPHSPGKNWSLST